MHNIMSFSVIAKVGLLVGVMLALFLLSSGLYDYAHARTAPETIDYEEGRTDAVAAFTAVDPEGHGIQWTLSGTDALDFSIDGGALTFKSTPDYENPVDAAPYNVYEVTVEAADGSNPVTPAPLIVKVIDVDEDGVVSLSALQPQEGIVLSATLTDADGGPSNPLPLQAGYTDLTDDNSNPDANTKWRWSRSSSKTGTFTDIVGTRATSKNYTPVADDVGMYLRATATYDDREGEGKTAHMVSANSVRAEPYENAPPVFKNEYDEPITGDIDRSVAENSAPGTLVGEPVVATDDAIDVLTYTLEGTDAGSFTIDSAGQIRVGAGTSINYEDTNNSDHKYVVTVVAADPANTGSNESRDTITVNIAVIDVDEAPTITGGDTAVDYPEIKNTDPNKDTVFRYTATDPEDNETPPVRWSLSAPDSGKFDIGNTNSDQGDLTFKASPDFENRADANSNNIYEVTVTATDSAGNTASRDVTVRVTNVEELGTITLSTLQPEAATPVRAYLSDLDGSISGLKWQWSKDDSEIPDATSSVYTPVDEDVGSLLTVTATYKDGAGTPPPLSANAVTNVLGEDTSNESPKFPDQDPDRTGDQSSSTSREVNENTDPLQSIGDAVSALDCDKASTCTINDSEKLTYSLEGRDAASFSIVRDSGQLQTKASLNYETKRSYTVTVKATDPSDLSDTISVTITVNDLPEAPVISGADPGTYAENGTGAVASYTARDPERDSVTWTLTGTDAADFSISGGTLRFKSPPDYETPTDRVGTGSSTARARDHEYEVTVRASDGGAMTTAARTITVMVVNVDEPGTVMLSTEQPKDGVAVTATLADPDGAESQSDGTVTNTDHSESNADWQWAQSSSRTGTFTNIRNATNATYTPVGGDDPTTTQVVKVSDVGKYLRATVTYMDPQSTRTTKTAFFVATRPVLKKDYVNSPPVFPDQNPDMTEIQNTTNNEKHTRDCGSGLRRGRPRGSYGHGRNRHGVADLQAVRHGCCLVLHRQDERADSRGAGKNSGLRGSEQRGPRVRGHGHGHRPRGGLSRNHSGNNRHQRGRGPDDHGTDWDRRPHVQRLP